MYKKIFFIKIIMLSMILLSCKKEEPEIKPPIIVKPATTEYLKFKLNSANQLTISQNEKNSYSIRTTGEDPYITTEGISKALHQDSVVLTFEYKSSEGIDKFQIFFGPSISESRSVFGNAMSQASAWKNYSVNLAKARKDFSWGKQSDFIRVDFGTKSGIDIEIRNIYFRSMNQSEKKIFEEEEARIKKDEAIEKALDAYLKKRFSSPITEVRVSASEITVTGEYNGEGKYSLCEIFPNDTLVTTTLFKNKIPLDSKSFRITLPRIINKNSLQYDRLLSRWMIVKEGNNKESIDSHARYADIIEPKQSMPRGILTSKKGLGGFFMNQYVGDLDELGITSITVNILVTGMIYTTPGANRVPHTYGGKTYYMSTDYLKHIDEALKLAISKKIVVAAIILVQKATECADPAIGKILQHPDFTSEGIYTMPNMTTDEGVNCYAAALDFLASRYNRVDNAYGRIHKWIMHNEVDAGLTWTNMGRKPMLNYLDTYLRSMRICHNITRQYDEHSEVMGSFTHSWVEPVELYSSREMLTALQQFSNLEGDFQWGVAYHPYPQDLNEPKTWMDGKATFSPNSALVTFKNLEVIDHWIKKPENCYKGSVKRTLWLSENGTNSRTYETKDLIEQAAGFAYAWKKLTRLDGIDAIQWHNWIDNRVEYGLRIGLRRFPDDTTDPGGPKPVWYAYQAAGTDKEDEVFEPYKSIIGITHWNDIMHLVSP
ncbi:DUF5722 domain-containing protein [Proteiniphilum sp.]|uniref:DUF5722 domain-containing protein n=1 Tax=Proteiniphilum sp. TaxID=1926877 RepID=UPI002B2076A9|nr:DUF5722 domain-containing protein [Proteiniphilum sp.]